MKILKGTLFFLGSIIALALIIALFVPKNYTIDRNITIDKPTTEVFDYVKYLKNQDDFSKWANMDPGMTKTYTGTDGQPGFISAWDSQNDDVGKGEQEILKITDGSRIDYELRFIKPFESTSLAYIETKSISANQTKVTWSFSGHMNYPMNLMLLFMNFEKMIGEDLNTGLANLKERMEQ
jgi:uncharacterized protein YndB with AHSA1/START domain